MADGQDVSKMSDQQIQDVIKSRAKEDTVIIKDLNPCVENLIICDNVLDKKGDGSVDGLDGSSLTTLMNNIFSHLVASVAVIGCGTMHNVGGYMGLKKAADLLNMTVPLLLLDIRQRDEQFMRVASTADKREQLQRLNNGMGGKYPLTMNPALSMDITSYSARTSELVTKVAKLYVRLRST